MRVNKAEQLNLKNGHDVKGNGRLLGGAQNVLNKSGEEKLPIILIFMLRDPFKLCFQVTCRWCMCKFNQFDIPPKQCGSFVGAR